MSFIKTRPLRVAFNLSLLMAVLLFAAACANLKSNAAAAGAKSNMTAGTEFKDCADCPAMVVLPAGQFVMGSPPDEPGRAASEAAHTVTLAKPFAVGKYGITFDEWAPCVAAKACVEEKDEGWGRGRRPVINVTWEEAQAYTVWLASKTGKPYRLLSEAEMEYAARAGTSGMRYWGANPNDSCQFANVYDINGKRELNQKGDSFACDDGYPFTAPVGLYKPNAFGLYDMLGNVLSWTADCHHDNYDGAPVDGSAWLTDGDCSRRMRRGGSFHSVELALRVAKRGGGSLTLRGDYQGFRVALSLP
jgi:formylglycine-generating enzyme required for sulfatase activity